MPLARNASGLLRRAASFVSACCCKKWLCDPFTQICSEDPSGPYTSEKQCNENCQRYDCDPNTGQCVATPTGAYANLAECRAFCEKKYKCDTNNYNCTEDPLGPYSTLKECEDNCKEPKHYCCGSPGTPEDRDCYDEPCEDLGLDEFGVYDTPEECDDKCKAPHYACDKTTYTCKEDPAGAYTDINLCNEECKPRYDCDPNTYKCFESPNGPYLDLKSCEDECKQRYNCRSSDYECIPDPDGPYYSLAECEKYCKGEKYYCCGSPGNPDDRDCYTTPCYDLALDDFGEYDSQEECDKNCKVDFYCCEDSDGDRFCDKNCEEGGANTVSGPYDSLLECDKVCATPKSYACREKSDGSKECVEDIFGSYSDDTCNGECDPPKKYTCFVRDDGSKVCIEKGDGEYDDDTCGGECEKAKYSCRDNGDGTSTCVEDPNGGYDDADCGGECEKPKKYSCQNGDCVEDANGAYDEDTCGGECAKKKYACQNGDCVPDPNGAYDDDTCGGSCDPNTFGACCTDYGLSNVTRQQCDDWGGTFYADGQAAAAACPCACDLDFGNTRQVVTDAQCTQANGNVLQYAATRKSYNWGYAGEATSSGADLTPIRELLDKGARVISWIDTVQSDATEVTGQCVCTGTSVYTKTKWYNFAYNCKKKEWEQVASLLSFLDSEQFLPQGPGQCLTTGEDLPVPAVIVAEPSGEKPSCKPPIPNPLP